VGLFGTLVEGPAHLSAVQFRFQSKDFFNDADINVNERRDGLNYMLGLLHVFRFAGDRHLIRVGYQYDLEDTRGRDFEYNGNRLLVGGQYTLPWWGTRLKYDYDVHFRNYRHVNSIFPVTSPTKRERHDTEQTHVVRIEQPLPAGFTLTFEFQGIVARSTLPVFSYNRSVMSLILSWQY
jgi:hypothetical protein